MFQFLIIESWRRIEEASEPSYDSDKIILNSTSTKPSDLTDLHQRLKLVRVNTRTKNAPPTIYESTEEIYIRAPPFQAHTTVEMAPTKENVRWKIGWIQAVTYCMTNFVYGDQGIIKMDIPELTSGERTMVSDNSPAQNYPWYKSKTGLWRFTGPCKLYQKATIYMIDAPSIWIPWTLPRRLAPSTQRDVFLTQIIYAASFYVWLVAWNETTNEASILKTIKWNCHYDVEIDPTKPLGQRARLISDRVPSQPEILAEDVAIPICAMLPPNANEQQWVVWYPKDGKVKYILGNPGHPGK